VPVGTLPAPVGKAVVIDQPQTISAEALDTRATATAMQDMLFRDIIILRGKGRLCCHQRVDGQRNRRTENQGDRKQGDRKQGDTEGRTRTGWTHANSGRMRKKVRLDVRCLGWGIVIIEMLVEPRSFLEQGPCARTKGQTCVCSDSKPKWTFNARPVKACKNTPKQVTFRPSPFPRILLERRL